MNSESAAIEVVKRSVEVLVGDLGAGCGLNIGAYEEISSALRFLAEHYRGDSVVPRDFVSYVYGLVGLMLGVCDRYGIDNAHEIRIKLHYLMN